MNLKSSVLIVDTTFSTKNTFGADVAADLKQAHLLIQNSQYSSVALSLKQFSLSESLQFLNFTLNKNKNTQLVLFGTNINPDVLKSITNQIKVFKIISHYSESLLEQTLLDAVSEYDLKNQNMQLLKLFQDQNDKLIELSLDLEERVAKRQKFLETSKEKLLQVNQYFRSLLEALFAIQRAYSVTEIENNLHKALSSSLKLSWVRIKFQSQNDNIEQIQALEFSTFSTDLILENKKLGKIIFARPKALPFSDEDQKFLVQISQAISLAMDRLNQLEKSEFLKQQWKSTFDAILEPVALIRADYELIDFNRSFSQAAFKKQKGKCYSILFNRKTKCENCTLGTTFQLPPAKVANNQEVLYEVSSHQQSGNTFVNTYRNIEDQKRVERQILESSKMAELGTIGSSIAHELNNPLAGLITFLQLIKSDLNGGEPYYNDIIEMQNAANKCKDIIQNLLSFTRKSSKTSNEKIKLTDAVDYSIKIVNLKAQSLGIKFDVLVKENLYISGQLNPFTQALVNILQNSIESISEKKLKDKSFAPTIEIKIFKKDSKIFLEITDNGRGLTPEEQLKVFTPFYTTKNPEFHRGLGLTVSYQIIQDQGGSIDLLQLSDQKTRASITFPSSF